MTPATFIEEAIAHGARSGVTALSPDERLVFLISEAEVLCDMEGIDSFLDRYAGRWLEAAASAFREVGALEIAEALLSINTATSADEDLLNMVNDLITSRTGYDYTSLEAAVSERLRHRV